MLKIEIYSTHTCPYCVRAKALFKQKGVSFTEFFIDEDDTLRAQMMERSQRRSVPQIFINNQHVGGCDDLYALEASHQLDALLKG